MLNNWRIENGLNSNHSMYWG